MRKYQIFIIGVVVSICVISIGFLVYTIEKIESESVVGKDVSGIVLYTTSKENSIETEKILKEIEGSLSSHIKVKSMGSFKSSEDIEEAIKEDAKDSINYSIVEFNRSNLVKEKGIVTIRIPSKEAINYRESLLKAERIKDKSKDLKINIIESRNTPKLLNTYIGIEISDIESLTNAKKILDGLILLDQ